MAGLKDQLMDINFFESLLHPAIQPFGLIVHQTIVDDGDAGLKI